MAKNKAYRERVAKETSHRYQCLDWCEWWLVRQLSGAEETTIWRRTRRIEREREWPRRLLTGINAWTGEWWLFRQLSGAEETTIWRRRLGEENYARRRDDNLSKKEDRRRRQQRPVVVVSSAKEKRREEDNKASSSS